MVSVIIPTYNREATICKAIESVLKQSYVDLEVIVVDDGSFDGTKKIVKNIEDPRVRYFYQENQGACAARNLGIDMAKGEYIAFHDSDDICRKERIEHQLSVIKCNDADLVFCAFQKHGYKVEEKVPVMQEGFKTFEDILMGMYVSTQTILGKRKVFEMYKFDPKIKRMQDYDIMIRIAQTEKVYFLNEVLVDLYLQEDSITNRHKGYNIPDMFFSKYPEIGEMYPKWKAGLLSRTAKELALMGENTTYMFKEIYMLDPSVKNMFKYLMARMKLLQIIFKVKK